MTGIAKFSLAALDCSDPIALAEFYGALTGWPVNVAENGEWVWLESGGGATIACQWVEDYRPPDWPSADNPQQAHFDFDVDDLDEAEPKVLALGATKVDFQPKPSSWRVYLDPAGHPFCLVVA